MEMEGMVRRVGIMTQRLVITQPMEDREPVEGSHLSSPYTNKTAVVEAAPEETDINIRKILKSQLCGDNEVQPGRAATAMPGGKTRATSVSSNEGIVDMQQTRQMESCVNVRQTGLSRAELQINMREDTSSCVDDLDDLEIIEELDNLPEKPVGPVTYGNDADVCHLLDEAPTRKGIILRNDQLVLSCDDGMYEEGLQYKVIPGTQSKGAYGEGAMCQDLKTQKFFMRKTVKKKLSRNEIEVPMMFNDNAGVPKIYGVNVKDTDTEIYQEFAGLSLASMMKSTETDYPKQLQDPKKVMLVAFQAFASLSKLHSQGVTHQDIKPENICLDITEGIWRLKFIDFGSSQTPKDQVMEGWTIEYLSPESCKTILEIANEVLPKEEGRLGPGTDVWALALSLLYCLCGYHVMVYVCTGQTAYPAHLQEDRSKLERYRMGHCLHQIANLKDEVILKKLICPEWPEPLKVLLFHTLRVDPKDRWSAKVAAEFILRNWILKGAGTAFQQAPPPAPTPVVTPAPAAAVKIRLSGSCLTPAALVIRAQPMPQRSVTQCTEGAGEAQAVHNTLPLPTPSTSSQPSLPDTLPASHLPAFTDLLPSDGPKKTRRRSRNKKRPEPYPSPAQYGFRH